MGKRKKGKATKKTKQSQAQNAEEHYKKAPHSFVINRGHVGKNVSELITDMRRVMSPYTASKLKTRRKNVLKDFVTIAGTLNVSHLLMFTKSETSTNLRVTRLPRGPTLTFQVQKFSLCKDVVSSLKRHNMDPKQFNLHPLLVMNNFTGEGVHLKLMSSMFQNLFPSINVTKVKLNDIRRCVLFNYNQEDETIEFRHYNIKVVPVGMGRAVKKLIKAKIPNMSRFDDVSEFVLGGGNLSESEAEMDGPHNEVVLPQHMSSRGNIKSAQSAIRLTEIGPRMTLQLVKIEDGMCSGDVLFHRFVKKTEKEIQAAKEFREHKKKLKLKRKQQQMERIKEKEKEKEGHKEKCLAGMDKNKEEEKNNETSKDAEEMSDEDDVEYYKQELGSAPDPDLFPVGGQKRKRKMKTDIPEKRKKIETNGRQQRKPQKQFSSNKSKGTSLEKTKSKKSIHRSSREQRGPRVNGNKFRKAGKGKNFKGKKPRRK